MSLCPDITKTVTPIWKLGDDALFILIYPATCLGGSALAQVFGQIGDVSPDLDDVLYLKKVLMS
ncbi:hypothetical protein Leryth_012600 [Lithospermum erythrorhizon]|nr:hypothetical protein Leryth_012600 [Lithospermum erythrorhizon]